MFARFLDPENPKLDNGRWPDRRWNKWVAATIIVEA